MGPLGRLPSWHQRVPWLGALLALGCLAIGARGATLHKPLELGWSPQLGSSPSTANCRWGGRLARQQGGCGAVLAVQLHAASVLAMSLAFFLTFSLYLCSELFIEQPVDHLDFNPGAPTWQERYYFCSEFYSGDPRAPILFYGDKERCGLACD